VAGTAVDNLNYLGLGLIGWILGHRGKGRINRGALLGSQLAPQGHGN
jgi:hypothetical protein